MMPASETVFDMQAGLCSAMAHPMRLEIIHLLKKGSKKVGSITDELQSNQPTISRHLSVLRKAGILTANRQGTDILYQIANPKIVEICEMMRGVLEESVDELANIMMQLEEGCSSKG